MNANFQENSQECCQENWKTEYFDELSSTSDYVKGKRQEGNNLIAVAKRQSGGRGTKGRSFSSEVGGVYLSALTFYKNFPAKRAFEIMASAAVAVCETLRFYGVTPVIKWANDVHVNGKKICGILIENVFSGANVSSSVVGIGVNVTNALPAELLDIATTLTQETGKEICVEEVTARLIEQLKTPHSMEEYLSYVGYMGERATLLIGEKRVRVRLIKVDKEGGLIVENEEGTQTRYVAAEVSLRLDD